MNCCLCNLLPHFLEKYGVMFPFSFIPSAFYETWWFITGCFALLVLVIWLYFRNNDTENILPDIPVDDHTRELKEALAALQYSENKLKQHSGLQDRLITALAHDIKSPLKYIALGAKELANELEKHDDKKLYAREARMLQDESYRVYLLTDNLLQYIKLNSQTGNINFGRLDLHSVVEEKVSIFRDIAQIQSTQIINDVPVGFHINSNRMMLDVIIHNLLDNATKVTRNGEIRLGSFVDNNELQIIISDTGGGMLPELVEWCNKTEITEPGQKSGKMFSAGLGLLIVKELLARIGGKLFVESDNKTRTKIKLLLSNTAID